MEHHKFENYNCDRCKFKYRRSELKLQKGLLVCPPCYDDIRESKGINMEIGGSPRSDADTTTAVESPTIFTITAAGGITTYHSNDTESSRSVTLEVEKSVSFGSVYYMKIVGATAALDITADPQIVAGQNEDLLTIHGTSDTNTVLLEDGTGVELRGGVSFTIGNNDVISLVYDTAKSQWVEVARNENGGF